MNKNDKDDTSNCNKKDILEILYGPKTLGSPEEEATKSVNRIFGRDIDEGDKDSYECKKIKN